MNSLDLKIYYNEILYNNYSIKQFEHFIKLFNLNSINIITRHFNDSYWSIRILKDNKRFKLVGLNGVKIKKVCFYVGHVNEDILLNITNIWELKNQLELKINYDLLEKYLYEII